MANERYQQLWLRGAPLNEPYQRECEPRYEIIRDYLKRYDRPISIFDLGANMGYFTFRIAEDFPQNTVIAADDKPDLLMLAEKNELSNVIVIPKRLSPTKIKHLSWCESFDVILVLNVLHHIDQHSNVLEWLIELGDVLIVETPDAGDVNAANPERHQNIKSNLERFGAKKLAVTKSHVSEANRITYVIDNLPKARYLKWATMDAERRGCQKLDGCQIKSELGQKTIAIRRYRGSSQDRRPISDFIPGMNLWNFHTLGGKWPTPSSIVGKVKAAAWLGKEWHDDIRPWNFVMSAGDIKPIDYGWKPKREPDVAEEWARYDLTETIAVLNGKTPFGWKSDATFI